MEQPAPLLDHSLDPQKLADYALLLRRLVVRMLERAKSGHTAGAMGLAEVFASLYFSVLNYRFNDPEWVERDRLFLSNGHTCSVWYAALALAGFFPLSELNTMRHLGTRLQGHPWRSPLTHPQYLPGIENTSGPLGQGISQALGTAWALKHDRRSARVYCVMSDAEFQEGQTWEALMFGMHHQLQNVTAIVDYNQIQISGFMNQVMEIEPLKQKLIATGWYVFEVNGHHPQELIEVFNQARSVTDRPSIILAHTIPGKGVSFMENDPAWHGRSPTAQEAATALVELQPLPSYLQAFDRID